ncbi:MAG: AAA domain-containing protein [Bacteriovoracaceae bacterium]|nr:AAA domain-containing protein [Bacteriovoracaceae bacterium]
MKQYDSIVLGALEIAQSKALKNKNTELTQYHILYGLLKNPQSASAKSFKSALKQVEKKLKNLPTSGNETSLENLRMNATASKWLTHASSNVIQNGGETVTEKDLLKLMPGIFPDLEINFELLKEDEQENECPAFLVDLGELASSGKLDPVIGRHSEIHAVMEILGRRGKNNPVLVGSAGVGKTAIVEGLAEKIIKEEVPDVLRGKTIYSLDLGQLMAGTKYRGEFEERLQQLLKFIKGKAGEAILFIDEIHQLVGAGKTDGAMDAANLLKPALARGELNCIGATTDEEYQKYILGDSALDRRFRPVIVMEPTREDATEILMGLKEKFEAHHGITISDESIFNAVYLSAQYINNKNLPDKAIDLIDEASSSLKLRAETLPPKLADLESEIRTKKIAIQMVEDPGKKSDEQNLIKELEADFSEKKAAWEEEVHSMKKVSTLKNTIDKARFDMHKAERSGQYEEASRIKYSVLPELEGELEECGAMWVLSKADIAAVISRQTGVPVEKILKSKQDQILKLEEYLNSRVFGQAEVLKEVSETLVASHAGLTDETRPLGSFLLKGPSGVGKTETAKALASFLFDHEENLIRVDLSEFSEKHSVAKLIGAPAGYVGYEEGGILTEAIRKRPYAVLLFDEIEKAHRDFSDILLQILDDGRLTDNKGRTISFKNTIILLTTNSKDTEADFKPEVLGRIDGILEYKHLDQAVLEKVVARELELLNGRLDDKGITLNLDDEVKAELIKVGHNETYGARPLRSAFYRLITRPLSKQILAAEFEKGRYKVGYDSKSKGVYFENMT